MASLRPPLDLENLTPVSMIDEALRKNPSAVREVKTQNGNIVHVLSVENVLYLSNLGLQIIGSHTIPVEGIVNPWNLGWLKRTSIPFYQEARESGPFASPFLTKYVAEDVCIISNMFSHNFSHFTEELMKVIILERAGFSGSYIYTNLPKFAFELWDALGMDRRRLGRAAWEPTIYKSAVYTTNIDFRDLSKCPDIFFELRDRMFTAAKGTASPFGARLWLDRGVSVANRDRDLVNSEEVDSFLEGYGFARLDIGTLPVLQQVAISMNADVIAGPHGSAFLHCMYMKPKSTVIEIFSPNYLNGYSFEICRVLRHQYVMIVDKNTPPDTPYPYGLAVHVPCNQLRLALERL
jgi:capsular polysaccharide biosynthesis protein